MRSTGHYLVRAFDFLLIVGGVFVLAYLATVGVRYLLELL